MKKVCLIAGLLAFSPTASHASQEAYYLLEDPSGPLRDSSGRGYNASIVNHLQYGVAGRVGQAVAFNGADAYAQAPSVPALTQAMTVMAWVKPDNAALPYSYFLSQGRDSWGSGWNLLFQSGRIVFLVNTDNQDNTSEISVAADIPNPTDWHHIAATYDGSKANVYVDGRLAGSGNGSGPIVYRYDEKLTLGRMAFADYFFFAGTLDEVRLFNQALAVSEIQTYLTPDTGTPGSPQDFQATAFAPGQINLQWRESPSAAGFILEIATDPNFSNHLSGYDSKDVGAISHMRVIGIRPSTTYFIRLRSYNASRAYSNWTNTQQATTPAITMGPVPKRPYSQIRSVAWILPPYENFQTYNQLSAALPQMKAEGYNTIYMLNPWSSFNPQPLTDPAAYNDSAFADLLKILDLLKNNGMSVIIGLNHLTPLGEGVPACGWAEDPRVEEAFENYVVEFLTRTQNYSDILYPIVFTEGTEPCGAAYEPLDPRMIPLMQTTIGSLPLRLPPPLRSKFVLGYHDYTLINLGRGLGASPIADPLSFDFLSMVAYGLDALNNSQIQSELDARIARFRALYPNTPLILGESGTTYCDPYGENRQADGIQSIASYMVTRNMGYSVWEWTSHTPGYQCTTGDFGIHDVSGAPRRAAEALSDINNGQISGLSIHLNIPQPWAHISEDLAMNAFASSPVGIRQVEFKIGNTSLAIVSQAPYQTTWRIAGWLNGSYRITAKATDNQGRTATSSAYVALNNFQNTDPTRPTPYFPLDELSGTTASDPYHPELKLTLFAGAQPSSSGKAQQALHIDGIQGYASSDAAPKYTQSLSVMAWVRAEPAPAKTDDMTFLSQGRRFWGSGWSLSITSGTPSSVVLRINTNDLDDTNEVVISAAYPGRNEWHHVAATYDTREARLYIDGQLVGSAIGTGPILYRYFESLTVGAMAFAKNLNFLGSIDEVKVFSQALTQNELLSAMELPITTGPTPDTTPPTISWESPTDDVLVSGTNVALQANAQDDRSTPKVEFYADSVYLGVRNAPPYTLSWNTDGLQNGRHTLTARAIDAANLKSESSISVVVNTMPTDTSFKPLATYTFDSSGQTLDLSDTSGHGYTLSSSASGMSPAVGREGYAARTDGISGYATSDSIPRPTTAFTIMAYVLPDTASKTDDIVIASQGRRTWGSGWSLAISNATNHELIFRVNSNNADDLSETEVRAPLSFGVWHHVAAVYSGTTATLYVDGQLAKSQPGHGSIVYRHGERFTLGAMAFASNLNFGGLLDNVKFYARAISAEEILSESIVSVPPIPLEPEKLPAPTLALPSVISQGDILNVSYPTSAQATRFSWTFISLAAPNAFPSSSIGRTREEASQEFSSPQSFISLAYLPLRPGPYHLLVRASDRLGRFSAPAEADIYIVETASSVVEVYPNPWRSDRHTKPITFKNVTPGTLITLFSVDGSFVRKLSSTGTQTEWDLKNDSGDRVASGLYLYLIQPPTGDAIKGKVSIIR